MYRACRERKEIHAKFWPERLKGKDDLEDLSIDGKIM
jgi:hypothetical protein